MRRFLPLLMLATAIGGVLPARAATHLVQVVNGQFTPATLEIAVGDTVQWLVQENGHTISAADYRFDFDPDRTLRAGETREWTFTADETVRYICRVHAPGMGGVITVGEGSPPPPPPPEITGESRRVPTTQYPTIGAALAGIPADSEIVLEPGTYEPFEVAVDEVLVRGARPDETTASGRATIDGGGIAKRGILIRADEVTVRDLDVVRAAEVAVEIAGDDATISYATLQSGNLAAINAIGVERTRIVGVAIAGHPGANAIAVDDPDALLIDASTITSAKSGIRVRGGTGVVVRGTTITATGTGIAMRALQGRPVIGAHLAHNRIVQTHAPVSAPDRALDLVSGAGIWLDGSWSARIEDNELARTLTYGVAVTGLSGPNLDVALRRNVVSEHGIAAEGWDGIGTFCTDQDNETDPPTLRTTNPCGAPTAGVPYPKVSSEVLGFAFVGTAVRDAL